MAASGTMRLAWMPAWDALRASSCTPDERTATEPGCPSYSEPTPSRTGTWNGSDNGAAWMRMRISLKTRALGRVGRRADERPQADVQPRGLQPSPAELGRQTDGGGHRPSRQFQ